MKSFLVSLVFAIAYWYGKGMRKLLRLFLVIAVGLALLATHVPAYAGNPPDAAQSSLVATSAGSDTAPADGTTTTSMTLTLKDSGGVALAGDSASLAISSDPTVVISPASATLDSNGQAVFTITSTQVGTDSIDVTDTTTSTTLTALGQITFTAVPTSAPSNTSSGSTTPSCGAIQPSGAPDLYQVNVTKTTATLFFSPPSAGPFDGYTIFYGLTQSADSYSVSFSQNQTLAANMYTINDLLANKTYYFQVRATNGCAVGPWSAIRASGYPATALKTLPATGPSDFFMKLGFWGIAVALAGAVLVFSM